MIYVFDCVKRACALPGKACLAIGEWCELLEKTLCGRCQTCADGLARCCTEAGSLVTDVADRPLSIYVLVEVALGLTTLRACLYALWQAPPGPCQGPGGVAARPWLGVQASAALLALLFAPYFQGRVWRRLRQEAEAAAA
eukprot:CAMPEP_0204524152 /NCGR_PEP_ID=MMETSP0661-20131031/7225_1 /ASSEMBLY_ACC=CAM_ASM_000606 /TAXON_ID=109239 /ORGANISM="Alexandrium margalefi, Strain AMGDE01CS-322" /LENGTH=139 /DNA_ID=CAMNT_0051529889 /DNA_START=76 /DNA_END=491 /DNA_ORIENTATION=+